MFSKFDDRRNAEHAILIHPQRTMSENVNVAFYEKKVGAVLHGQKARARYVNPTGFLEMFDPRTSCGFKLENLISVCPNRSDVYDYLYHCSSIVHLF